ncbi:MAG: glycosyltransferase family 9 protein [Rhabdochlamydiaceae bacterium]|nr:glycosyltransferase family 9 protein [Rhabdochlamydiaceae bacterium]
MSRQYLVQNKIALLFLRTIDRSLSFFNFIKRCFGRKNSPLDASCLNKILICNLAHMGDVVMSTAFISEIKKQHPNSKIGVLLATWSRAIVSNLPLVDHVHVLDHWKLNRSSLSMPKKIWHYIKQRRKVIKEIQLQHYEMSIDLYPYFPNAIPIVWRGKIPMRLGYTSGGFGPLLTHSLEWVETSHSMIDDQLNLLKLLGGIVSKGAKPVLSTTSSVSTSKNYLVFHMGAGLDIKEWPENKWKTVLEHFTEMGYDVYFTGKGTAHKAAIQRVMQGVDRAVDFSDVLNWNDFVSVIRYAKLLISVDSVSGHIASAFDVPTVSLFTGMNCLSKWKPVNPNALALIHKVSCAPCYKKRGCERMECIREIQPEEVINAAIKLLERID